MIYRCRCKCPNDHLIEGVVTTFGEIKGGIKGEAEVLNKLCLFLKTMMELWICDGKLGDICEICQAPLKDFRFLIDKKEEEGDPATMKQLWAEFVPDLERQKALRNARLKQAKESVN